MEKKLFIYIPTFNRPEALNRQLDVLLPQVIVYKDKVRILVRDNNSETKYFIALKKNILSIVIYRLKKIMEI
jgi:GT2 family glycosyltransferase